jgi:hypothetical protein
MISMFGREEVEAFTRHCDYVTARQAQVEAKQKPAHYRPLLAPKMRTPQGWWGGLLETERKGVDDGDDIKNLKHTLQRSTPAENYSLWKRTQHRFHSDYLQMLERYAFPPIAHSTPECVSFEKAAKQAFGKDAVLLARDHLAVVMSPAPVPLSLKTVDKAVMPRSTLTKGD